MAKREGWVEVKAFWERHHPWIAGVVATVLITALYRNTTLHISEKLSRLIDAVITFGSVNVGFVGVLLGVLFSARDTPLVSGLLGNTETKTLTFRYFKEAIISGLMLVILSAALHMLDPTKLPNSNLLPNTSTVFIGVWTGLVVYALLSSYRIMNLMMRALFKSGVKSSEIKTSPSSIVDDNERAKLRDQFKRGS